MPRDLPDAPPPITVALLRSKGACEDQVDTFRSLFGDAAPLTVEAAVENAASFDWNWAADRLLSAPARVEYRKVHDAARAEYEKVRDADWAEYEKVRDAAWAEYRKVSAPARAEYEKVSDAARAEYQKVRACTFARLYLASQAA